MDPTDKTSAIFLKADSMFQLVRKGFEGADIVFARFGKGLAAEEGRPLAAHPEAFYLNYMKQIIDIDERSRLPWRFFGAANQFSDDCEAIYYRLTLLSKHPRETPNDRPEDTL